KIDWANQVGRRVKLRDLHVFFMVAQHGSMAEAARQLGVSQPAVSEVIADLEHVYGGPTPVVENSKSSCDEPPQLMLAAVGRSGLIEIIVGGGNRIRVDTSFDAGALARVLDVVERR